MSDERELTSEQEARVGRLLAESRADEPAPDDVVARLDRVLRRLAEGEELPAAPRPDRSSIPSSRGAAVVELARVRRRRFTTLLVAAAAAVVVGVGLGQVLPGSQSGDDAATSEAPAAADDAAGGVPEAALEPSGAAGQAAGPDRGVLVYLGADVVRSGSFAADVARVRAAAANRTTLTEPSPGGIGSTSSTADFGCAPAPWGPGELYGVTYDGTPAVLAFRSPVGKSQVVDLLECGSAAILRSVTLPAG